MIQIKKRVIQRERERSRESDSVTLLIYDASSYTCNKSMEITNGIQINGKNENYFIPMIIFSIDLGTIFLLATS